MNMRIFWIAALSVVVFAEAAAVDLLEQAQLQQGVGKVEFVFRNGRRMLRLTGRTPKPRPNGNAYLKFRLKLAKPVSLTGKAVRFRVEAARSPEYGGVIFNAFAPRAEKPAWSLMRWDKRLFSRHSLPYVLSAGSDRTLKWQTPPGADGRVDRLEFMFGSPFAGKEGEFYISEISVGPEHSPDDPVIQLEAERLPFPTENVEVVADRRFSGGKGIRLRDGVTDGAVEAQFQVHPGHYILSLTVAAEESVVREMKKMVNNADSPRLGIFCDDGPRRQRVVIYAHEAHNPFKERDVMDLRLTGGKHQIRIELRPGIRLDKLLLTPYQPPAVPEAAAKYQPSVVPPPEHPRVFLSRRTLPEIRRNLTHPENRAVWEKLQQTAASPARPRIDNPEISTWDRQFEQQIQAMAFVALMKKDRKLAREAAAAYRDYLHALWFDNMTDVTRSIGHTILTAALVYDWCFDSLKPAERAAMAARMIELAEQTEIGYPPFRQMVVNGHGNEMQFTRDMIAMGIALYDENPLPYRYNTYRFFEEIVPMHSFEYRSLWHNQGMAYGVVRFSGDVIAALLYERMNGVKAFPDYVKTLPYSWFYLRLPDGTMFRDGDDFYMTNQRGMYSSNYQSTFLSAAYSADPVLKGESKRQEIDVWKLNHPVQFLLLNNPLITAQSDYSHLPLTRIMPPPYPAMAVRTGWTNGKASRDVIAFLKGANYQSAGHQHLDAGSFQLYYRGLQAVDLGIYHHFGSPYDRNFNKRSIAHNTLLAYDPKEDWGWLSNDGGQQYFCGWPSGMSPANLKEMREKSQNGELLAADFGPDQQKPFYSFFKNDLAAAYTKKISRYVRSFLFLHTGRRGQPASLVVFDRVKTSGRGIRTFFVLNTLARPEKRGNTLVSRYGNGKLTTRILLPEGALRVESYSDAESRRVFGKQFDIPLTGLPEENGTRTMISPTEQQEETEFLTVLQPGDPEVKPAPIKFVKGRTHLELFLEDTLVLLGRDFEPVSESVTFSVPTSGGRVVFADFAAGQWTVLPLSGSGREYRFITAAGKLTGMLRLPPGSYRLIRR